MDYQIRHMQQDEWPMLADFLYEAIYVPEDYAGEVPRSIIEQDPKCRAAYEGFGGRPDDSAFVATVADRVIGACWVRTTDEYGHIDDQTPSFSISLYKPYRGRGIGTALMSAMLSQLKANAYARASLSVQKQNPALHLYERMGFRIVGDGADETEWLMVCRLNPLQNTPLTFRKLEASDISTLADLRILQLLEEGAQKTCDLMPALCDYYERHLANNSFVSWLAMADGQIVGTSGISIVEKPPYFGCPTGRIALVSSMYVKPEFRRQGIARDLLLRIVEEARGRRCGVVQITASNMGVPLYGSCGFTHNKNFMQLAL